MDNYLRFLFVTLVFGLGLTSFAFASSDLIESHLEKVYFSSSKSLPKGPNPTVEANCVAYTATDLTQTSKTVRDRGWIVTSQVKYGPFELISFAGSLESITSGMCIIKETNIAIFEMQKLVGFFYTDPEIDTELSRLHTDGTGKIQVISGGGVGSTSFEITFRANRITLDTPSYTTACEGDGIIPTLISQSIFEAKKELFEFGWKPTSDISGSEEFRNYYEKDPYYETIRNERNLPELVTCSGTGVGYCKYLYENDKSYLEIDTVSDGDQVVSLHGFCK